MLERLCIVATISLNSSLRDLIHLHIGCFLLLYWINIFDLMSLNTNRFLNMKIQEGEAHNIFCPAYDCFQLVPVEIIESVVSKEMDKRYLQFDIKVTNWCIRHLSELIILFFNVMNIFSIVNQGPLYMQRQIQKFYRTTKKVKARLLMLSSIITHGILYREYQIIMCTIDYDYYLTLLHRTTGG